MTVNPTPAYAAIMARNAADAIAAAGHDAYAARLAANAPARAAWAARNAAPAASKRATARPAPFDGRAAWLAAAIKRATG